MSSIANNQLGPDGKYNGIAPDANLVVVQSFDEQENGSYIDVIDGINWIVTNRYAYDIRILNLSFSAPPQSYYWDDPLNQAVMAPCIVTDGYLWTDRYANEGTSINT